MGEPEVLDIKVDEGIKTEEQFGKLNRQLKGSGGTLHITQEKDITEIGKLAWKLSEQTALPVVIVVRSPRKV